MGNRGSLRRRRPASGTESTYADANWALERRRLWLVSAVTTCRRELPSRRQNRVSRCGRSFVRKCRLLSPGNSPLVVRVNLGLANVIHNSLPAENAAERIRRVVSYRSSCLPLASKSIKETRAKLYSPQGPASLFIWVAEGSQTQMFCYHEIL